MTVHQMLSGSLRLTLQATLAFSLFLSPLALADRASIDNVRLRPSPERTRIVFDLGSPVQHKVFALENPERLVIDIENAALEVDFDHIDLRETPIRRLRSGIRDGQDVRVVLDLTENVKPQSFVLKPIEQYGDRLVVDLYTADQQRQQTAEPRSASGVSGQMREVVIAIDAGHGGEDPGAIGHGGVREKEVVLSIAERVAALFAREPGYRPHMIRTDDYYVALRRRTELARLARADVFLSIHADAFKTSSAQGASVYAISHRGATSETARWLAEKENRADLIGGVGGVSLDDKDDMLAGVLLDLSMTASLAASLDLGARVLGSMENVSRLHKRQVEQAGFVVLKSPDVPSILIETGYISNPGEAAALATRGHQRKLAQAIFYGVKNYMDNNPPPGTLLAWQKQRGDEDVREYVIERGDTLSGIADKHQISAESIKKINGLNGDLIKIGQVLKIPTS
ncbi:MAG: N-acetylmuramoyl-L-alanine amidase [Pseudomonadales bacterium]